MKLCREKMAETSLSTTRTGYNPALIAPSIAIATPRKLRRYLTG
jgi:hypothetical protein